MSAIDSESLRALVVWVPMSGGQEEDIANASARIADSRAQHFWDAEGDTMQSYKEILGTPWEAWDVYLVYERGRRWDGTTPPAPDYWMHQLRSKTLEGQPLERGVYFDPNVFREEIESRLAVQ